MTGLHISNEIDFKVVPNTDLDIWLANDQ